MPFEVIQDAFPNIAIEGYEITSADTLDYNCFAWAMRDEANWWSHAEEDGHTWRAGVPRTGDVACYIELFRKEGGFKPCQDPELEDGYEKIAIYALDGMAQHAARQLPSGRWTSKLGDWEDIQHDTLAALEGDLYGNVVQIMKRERI